MRAVIAFLGLMFFISQPVFAGCTLDEIKKMARGGSGRDAIKSACNYQVDDAPRCDFSRVLALVMAKKAVYEIEDECGLCDRPRCETTMGSCGLGARAPKGIKEGDDCHCFSPGGPIMGMVSCNN